MVRVRDALDEVSRVKGGRLVLVMGEEGRRTR